MTIMIIIGKYFPTVSPGINIYFRLYYVNYKIILVRDGYYNVVQRIIFELASYAACYYIARE